MPIKRVQINLFITLLLVWLLLNTPLSTEIVLSGLLLSALLAYFIAPMVGHYAHFQWTPLILVTYCQYFAVFLVELVKANLHVAKIVITPDFHISPAIIKIPTELSTPLGRLALCNSITLTPGTLVIDIQDNALFVHCITVNENDPEQELLDTATKFERYLKVIYG